LRRVLVVSCLLLSACGGLPPRSTLVEHPTEWQDDWIRSSPRGSKPVQDLPRPDLVMQFGRPEARVAAIRVGVAADDFHGSKLYDGFDFELQPLGPDGRPVKKLGHLSVILYQFRARTLAGTGRELMRWHVPASKMVTLWTGGVAGGCYHMKLAWGARPRVKYVKMEVRFTTLDGMTYTELKTPDSLDQPRYRWLRK